MKKNLHIEEVQKLMEEDFTFSSPDKTEVKWLLLFSQRINELIEYDFPKLVAILYRLDVNEARLSQLLKDYPNSNAGKVIGELIIERQLQKIKSREAFRQKDENIDENEKW